jgi:hypothetical protein
MAGCLGFEPGARRRLRMGRHARRLVLSSRDVATNRQRNASSARCHAGCHARWPESTLQQALGAIDRSTLREIL